MVGDTDPGTCSSVKSSASGNRSQSTSSAFSPPRMPVSQSCTRAMPIVTAAGLLRSRCRSRQAAAMPDSADLAVDLAHAAHRRLPRELLRARESLARRSRRRARRSARDRCRRRSPADRTGSTSTRRVAGHLGQRRDVRRDDRRAAGHRLERRQPEPFVEGGEDEHAGQPVHDRQRLFRQVAEEADVLGAADAGAPRAAAPRTWRSRRRSAPASGDRARALRTRWNASISRSRFLCGLTLPAYSTNSSCS